MKTQVFKLQDKEYKIQDLTTREKLRLQGIMATASGEIRIVESLEYLIKNVVLEPEDLNIDDLSISEINTLYAHILDFLDLKKSTQTVTVVETTNN